MVGFNPLPTVEPKVELVIFDDNGAVIIGTFGNFPLPVTPVTIGTREPPSTGTIAGVAAELTIGAGNGVAAEPARAGRSGVGADGRGANGLATAPV